MIILELVVGRLENKARYDLYDAGIVFRETMAY